MARRSDHSHREIAKLAIRKGLEIIKQSGFATFSARKVAQGIGYTVGTLYNVFGSYDDMMLHINAATLDEWYEAMEAGLQQSNAATPVHALALAYIDYSQRHHHQWHTLFEYRFAAERDIPEWYRERTLRFFHRVERELLPVVGNDATQARQAAHVLWAGIHGICVLSLSGKLAQMESGSAEMLALSLVDNYLKGLTASDSQ